MAKAKLSPRLFRFARITISDTADTATYLCIMKRYFLLITVLLVTTHSYSQNDPTIPPYKRFPTYPPVKILLADSSYFGKDDLTKKSSVMLMLFSPQCNHCQHETEEILNNIDRFKKIQIVMATMQPFDSMTAFIQKYELDKYDNIIVGRDVQYFLSTFFMIRNLPFLAFYNRKKELISVFEGALPIPQVLDLFDE